MATDVSKMLAEELESVARDYYAHKRNKASVDPDNNNLDYECDDIETKEERLQRLSATLAMMAHNYQFLKEIREREGSSRTKSIKTFIDSSQLDENIECDSVSLKAHQQNAHLTEMQQELETCQVKLVGDLALQMRQIANDIDSSAQIRRLQDNVSSRTMSDHYKQFADCIGDLYCNFSRYPSEEIRKSLREIFSNLMDASNV